MDTKLPRALGAFTIFFTLALPLFAARVAAAVYTPLVNLVSRSGASSKSALNELYFNNFKVAVSIPILLGVAGATAAFLVWRKRESDTVVTLGRLLFIQTFVAFLTLLWFAAYVVAAVMA